jgi:predicted small lipoprotein YifL
MKRLLLALVFALSVASVVGCGGGSSTTKGTPAK